MPRPEAPRREALHDLQRRVMNALLGDPSNAAKSSQDAARAPAGVGALDAALSLIDAADGAAAARLHVYRNNVLGNFMDALRSSYPVILRLIGDDYFRQVARQFFAHHPSMSGDLLHAGEPFPAFLAELHRAGDFRYLADVARFEWLVQETLLAGEHAPLDLGKLAGVAPSAYDAVRFELHPALRLFESRYPAHRIWEVNVAGDDEPEPVDLGSGGDRLAVMQSRSQLQFHRLTPGELCFLRALRHGGLASAIAAGSDDDAGFDAGAALRRFVAAQIIVDCH